MPDLASRLARTLPATVALALTLAACGGDPPPPTCNGTSCACDPGAECAIGDSGCAGNSCSLACPEDATCTGACGSSCSISCVGSSCDVTVGDSSSVSCTAGATCTVQCTGTCSLSCGADASCAIQCAGDASPRSVAEGASCE